MSKTMIEIFNSTVSDALNKGGSFYETWIGETNFTPAAQILKSEDVNCGAICNELEFAREVSDYFVESLDIDAAESDELVDLINAFIDLPRRGELESDETFRKRYKFIVVQQINTKRTTRWAILDALRYFVADVTNSVQITEQFDTTNLYFQVRIEGVQSTNDIIFLNNLSTAWVDQNYVGGPSLGAVITYVGELINRIKAAGVDYDILFIDQDRFTKTSDAFLGTVQVYKTCDARVEASISFNKFSNAQIV